MFLNNLKLRIALSNHFHKQELHLNGQSKVQEAEPEELSPLAEAQRTLANVPSLDDTPAPMQLSPDNEMPGKLLVYLMCLMSDLYKFLSSQDQLLNRWTTCLRSENRLLILRIGKSLEFELELFTITKLVRNN